MSDESEDPQERKQKGLGNFITDLPERDLSQDVITPKTARKTFSQIMYDTYEFHIDEISIFTNHTTETKGELSASYVDTSSIMRKRKLFDRIKLPDGKSKDTDRSSIL